MCGLHKFPFNVNSVLLVEYNLLYNGFKCEIITRPYTAQRLSVCVINEDSIFTPPLNGLTLGGNHHSITVNCPILPHCT